eukprot:COSAG05_NODE_2510_length_2968_cov_4.077727_2_plen_193_part_00
MIPARGDANPMAQPVAVAQQPQMQLMQVQCPPNVQAGMMIQIQTTGGQPMQVQVPAGVGPGMTFTVQVADPAAAAPPQMAMAQPVVPQQQPPQMNMQKATPAAPPQAQPTHSAQGYHVLAQFGDLFIKQQIEMLEVFTGFEGQNKYDVFGTIPGMGQQHIFHAAEDSECIQVRQHPPCLITIIESIPVAPSM